MSLDITYPVTHTHSRSSRGPRGLLDDTGVCCFCIDELKEMLSFYEEGDSAYNGIWNVSHYKNLFCKVGNS